MRFADRSWIDSRLMLGCARWGRGVLVTALVAASSGAVLTPSAWAAWLPPVAIGQGPAPRNIAPAVPLGFSPSGGAALAFETSDGAIDIVRRPARGQFSPPDLVTSGPDVTPASVVLPAGGTTVLLYGESQSEPATAVVESPGALQFGLPRQFGGTGDPEQPFATLAATTRGEVIASIMAGNQNADAAVLGRAASTFGPERGLPPGAGEGLGVPEVAVDAAGGAFVPYLIGQLPGQHGCPRALNIAVAYRPAGGRFRADPALRCLSNFSSVSTVTPGGMQIAAAGKGRAALLTLLGSPSRQRVVVQTGRQQSFGTPHVLASTRRASRLAGPPVIDARGNVTVAWDDCRAALRPCTVGVAAGNVNGRFGRTQHFAFMGDTTFATVGDRSVALGRCHGLSPAVRCMIGVTVADRHGHFGKPRIITRDGFLDAFERDARGDQLLAWHAKALGAGDLFAATRTAGSSGFGAPHLLAREAVGGVSADFGPDREAIVAWRTAAAGIAAAVYQVQH